MKYYFGYLADQKELLSVSSGGFCTALARHVVCDGGVVYGKGYTDDFRNVRNVRVTRTTDVELLKGSKYIYSNEPLPISEIISDLAERKKVVFIGLPCEVAAIQRMLKKEKMEITGFISVDLICHGPTAPAVASSFLDHLEKKHRSKIVSVSTRYKKNAWIPAFFRAEFKNGKEYVKPFYETDYGIAFTHYIRKQCYECKFKGEDHEADITVGDGWGIPKEHVAYNSNGVSVIVVRNPKVEELLYSLKGFKFVETNEKEALSQNPRYYTSPKRSEKCVQFERDFEEFGLHKACFNSLNARGKIRYYLPTGLVNAFRKWNSFFRGDKSI